MVFSNNLLLGAGGQSTGPTSFDTTLIGNSVWLDGSADLFTKSSFAGNASKKVISTWVQRTGFSAFGLIRGTNASGDRVGFGDNTTNNQLYIVVDGKNLYSNQVFRDIGWYHYLVSFDLALSGTDKVKVYINGVDVDGAGGWETDERSTMSTSFGSFNSASVAQQIGRDGPSSMYLSAYLAQYCELDGQSIQGGDVAVTDFLDTFTFGTNGSQFIPKSNSNIAALASTAGANSFCLDFANSSDLGNDISSNNKDFTPTSIDSDNQSTSTPSKNYAVMDVLKNDGSNTSTMVFSEGNTRVTGTGGSDGGAFSTLPLPTTGTTEFQSTFNNGDGVVGICCYDNLLAVSSSSSRNVTGGLGVNYNAAYGYQENGEKVVQLSSGVTRSAQGAALTTNSVVTVRYDADSNEITFLKDNVVQGSAVSTVAGLTYYAFVARFNNYDITLHFDSADFPHTIGSGNKTIDTANLSAPTYQGIDYFAPTLYEGNGTGQRVGDFVPFTDAFNVANSAMFQHDEARALSRTAGAPSSSGGKKGTWSTWYKTANIDTDNIFFDNGTTATNRFSLQMDASGQIVFSYAGTTILMTNADLKGGGLWRNLVLKVDTSLATASARAIMYIDGVEVTSFATDARASLTQDGELGYMDSGATQFVGSYNGSSANQWDGYLAETIFLDNQFLSADSFGQLDTSTNKWVPKAISGLTLGDQGFYLAYGGDFDTGNGAGDSTGNANNLSVIGTWTSADQFIDTPSANYATLNRIIPPTPSHSTGGNATMSQGNLKWDVDASTNANSSFQTTSLAFQIQDGKWYYELESVDSAGGNLLTGLVDMQNFQAAGSFISDAVNGQIAYGIAGSSSTTDTIFTDTTTLSGSNSPVNGADDIDNGDVLGVYIEKSKDTYNFWFSRNGTMLVRDTSGLPIISYSRTAPMCVFVRSTNGTTKECALNFGQQMVFDGGATTASAATGGRWKHVPTNTAYKALNVDNLDDTASKITAWAWIKNRDATDNHMLFDRIRGVSNDIHSNDTAIEVANANTVQRFLQRGVQVGSDVEVNTANESYVLWQWLLGDSATTGTAISADNPPTIASTNLASDNGSFGICTYTGNTTAGATVKHSLDGVPEMILFKRYGTTTANWMVYHKDTGTGNSDYLMLDTSGAKGAAGAVAWLNATTPTSTLVTLGSDTNVNASDKYVMYLFRSIAGVCKVGSYTGNLNDNGPYVSTGFKPSYVMIKSTTTTRDWVVFDTSRDPINMADHRLDPSNTGAEFNAALDLDILSDGFKFRSDDIDGNASGVKYIYLAMADIGGNGTLPPVYGR